MIVQAIKSGLRVARLPIALGVAHGEDLRGNGALLDRVPMRHLQAS